MCFDFEDGNCKKEDACRFSHENTVNLTKESKQDQFKREWLGSHSLQVDSGAAKSITGDLSTIGNCKPFDEIKFIFTITGSRISVLGMGQIGFVPVYYSPEADSGVLATKDLQKRGMMTVFPPGENSGCWIVDTKNGAVIMKCDKDYNIDSTQLQTLQTAGNTNDEEKIGRK